MIIGKVHLKNNSLTYTRIISIIKLKQRNILLLINIYFRRILLKTVDFNKITLELILELILPTNKMILTHVIITKIKKMSFQS